MRIPRSYVEAYSSSLNALSEVARMELEVRLSAIDWSLGVADIRHQVAGIMETCCGASATIAARLAADFYDGLRAEFGISDGFHAVVDSRRDPKGTEGAIRAFVQDLVDGKPVETFVGKCSDRVDRETRLAANQCIEHNAKRDPKKPRWARVPTGHETCEFCIMLASRGFKYHTKDLASHSHPNCDCRVMPSWEKDKAEVEGYDPAYYLDCYMHPEAHPEVREAINERRREQRAAAAEQEEKQVEQRYQHRIEEAEMLHPDFYTLSVSEVAAERMRYDSELRTEWSRYKAKAKIDGISPKVAYDTTVGEYFSSLSESGRMTIESFVDMKNNKGHEAQLSKWFADAGHSVVLRNAGNGDTNDALIDDVVWEYKRITSKHRSKIIARVTEHIPRQGPRFVVDLSENHMNRKDAESTIAELLDKDGVGEIILVMGGNAKRFKK